METKIINIRKELNELDRQNYRDLRNMYDSLNLTQAQKKAIVRLINEKKEIRLEKYLNTLIKEDFENHEINNSILDFDDKPVAQYRKINNKWKKMKDEDICVICGDPIQGRGNNARPVATGKCCDRCNRTIVIPARLKAIRNESLNESIGEDRLEEIRQEMIQLAGDDITMGNIQDPDSKEEFIVYDDESYTEEEVDKAWEIYQELVNLGPSGFYSEYKDEYEFDDDFIAEFGDEDDYYYESLKNNRRRV